MSKKFQGLESDTTFKQPKKRIFQKFALGNILYDCLLVSCDTGPYQFAFRRGVLLFLSPRLDILCVPTDRPTNLKRGNNFFEVTKFF